MEKASFYNSNQSRGNVSDGEVMSHGDVTYNLNMAVPGDTVCVLTDQGMHKLTKTRSAWFDVDNEGEPVVYLLGAAEGWAYDGRAVELTVSDSNPNGTAYITPRNVLRAGDEFGVKYEGTLGRVSTTRSLGCVAGYADMLSAKYEKFVGA